MKIPLLADKNMAISRAYGVLKEDEGLSFRGLFIIDGQGESSDLLIWWEESLIPGYFLRKAETDDDQRSPRGPRCGRDPQTGPGLPVH